MTNKGGNVPFFIDGLFNFNVSYLRPPNHKIYSKIFYTLIYEQYKYDLLFNTGLLISDIKSPNKNPKFINIDDNIILSTDSMLKNIRDSKIFSKNIKHDMVLSQRKMIRLK